MDERDFEGKLLDHLALVALHLDALSQEFQGMVVLLRDQERAREAKDAICPPAWVNNTHTQERR